VQEETRKYFRLLALVSSMGISMGLSLVIGLLIGYYLDKWLQTQPVFFFIFLLFGIAAGFKNIYIILKRTQDKI
jgi:ATP synthase protein I